MNEYTAGKLIEAAKRALDGPCSDPDCCKTAIKHAAALEDLRRAIEECETT